MSKRKIFNTAYFITSIAVFSWLLRDDPHWRMLPIVSILMSSFYGLLALVSVLKPNGFAVSHEVFSLEQQSRYRRWALLIPVPAILYMALYSACVQFAGQAPCLNKFYGPIAKIERAAFSRGRMLDFYHKTHPRLLQSALGSERKHDWAKAESYYRAVTSLENRLCHKKRPASYAIMACLYQRMGDKDKAEQFFLKSERLANKHCKYHQSVCKHGEIVAVGHALKEMDQLGTVEVALNHPWLSKYLYLKDAPAAALGRRFVDLDNVDSLRHQHDHAWCTSAICLKSACDKENEQYQIDVCEHPGTCLTHGLFGKREHDCDDEGCKDECKDHRLLLQLCPSHKCEDKDCRNKDHDGRSSGSNCKDEDCTNEDHDHKLVFRPKHSSKKADCKDDEGHDRTQLRYPQFDTLELPSI